MILSITLVRSRLKQPDIEVRAITIQVLDFSGEGKDVLSKKSTKNVEINEGLNQGRILNRFDVVIHNP
jgi:hypothetical protein